MVRHPGLTFSKPNKWTRPYPVLAHSSSSGNLNESPDVVSNRNRRVMNQLDPRYVFGRHDRGLAKTFIRYHAAEVYNFIPHCDAELHRPPVILLDRCDHAAADVSSSAVGSGTSRARLATARSKSDRLTIPTSVSSRITGRRLISWRSINRTKAASEISGGVTGAGARRHGPFHHCRAGPKACSTPAHFKLNPVGA